jgi:ABC-type lipoprotein export system ATPase subunit
MTEKKAVSIIEANNLTKVYIRKNSSPVKAIDGVSLNINAGEFLALVGCSGSGKTTMLNLIGALDRPTSGDIIFQGKNLSDYSSRDLAFLRRNKIGFIFQTFNLLPSLTVFENIECALVHSEIPKEEQHEKISALLRFLDISDKSDRLPVELSVGQQQKAAIARAIIKDPILILADEPTGEMDPMAGEEIAAKLVGLVRDSGVALVVATHGTFTHAKADRTLFLKNGTFVSERQAGY